MLRRHRHSHQARHDVRVIIDNLIERTDAGDITWSYKEFQPFSVWHATACYKGSRIEISWDNPFGQCRLYDRNGNEMDVRIGRRDAARLARRVAKIAKADYKSRQRAEQERSKQAEKDQAAMLHQLAAEHADALSDLAS